MSVGQAFKYAFKNKYVLALTGMIFMYGFVMVVGELNYKDILKFSYQGQPEGFASMKGLQSTLAAATAVIMMIFITHNVIRIFGWKVTALIAPSICTIFGVLFYVLCLSNTEEREVDGTLRQAVSGEASVWLRWVGITFIFLTQAVKYGAFDPAKELAFLPLSKEEKDKGNVQTISKKNKQKNKNKNKNTNIAFFVKKTMYVVCESVSCYVNNTYYQQKQLHCKKNTKNTKIN